MIALRNSHRGGNRVSTLKTALAAYVANKRAAGTEGAVTLSAGYTYVSGKLLRPCVEARS